MKRLWILLVVLLIGSGLALADFQAVLDKADQLHKSEDYEQSRSFLETSLGQAGRGAEQAEIYWRLARAWLNLGDKSEDRGVSGNELLAYFEKGEAQAQKAIEVDPKNHLGYYWKSANIGRWGQIKGILNSLFKAKPMRDLLRAAVAAKPDHADSYYVLGQLFEQVPGFPVSFGDKDYAVSLGRKSIDLHEQQLRAGIEDEKNYDFYTEMAKHLWERNWEVAKRNREQGKKPKSYNAASDPMEKNSYYEGNVTLKNISDRAEALEMIRTVIRELENLANRTGSQNDDLKEAKEVLAGWQ